LVLAEAGIDFVDERIEYDGEFKIFGAWRDNNKDKVPFGQLPVLIDGDLVLPQSMTVARYLAQKYGLRGKDEKEAALADAVADQSKDFFEDLLNGRVQKIPTLLGYFESWLGKNTSGFFTAHLTYGDLLAYYVVDEVQKKDAKALEKFPLVAAHHNRVASRPNIAAWLKKRPESPL